MHRFICLILLMATMPAADTQVPAQAQAILDQFDKDVQAAKTKALKALRVQQQAVAKSGNLALAAEIKAQADELETEVGAAGPKPSEAQALAVRARQLVGVYITPSGSAFTFRGNGVYTSGVLGWSPSGAWKVLDQQTVELRRPDGTKWQFTIDGLNLFNQTDKVTWKKQQ